MTEENKKKEKSKSQKREEDLEKTRDLLTNLLLEVKFAAIRAGAVPTKHIGQIQDRMRASARQSATAEEWYTTLSRKLNLDAPNNSTSSTLDELVIHVRETIGNRLFLDLIEREHAYLIALMRLAYDEHMAEKGVK